MSELSWGDEPTPTGTETDKERVRRDRNYDESMRQCRKQRGYAIDAPPVDDPTLVRYK